jgi:tetratricopeptide (TPR) repeat protein
VEVLTAPATVAQRVEKTDGTAILDDGARRALDLLDASPLVRAQLLHAFGDAQRRCFNFHTAGPLLKESVADLDSLVGPNDPSALAARDSLARLYQDSHHYLEAERLFRRTYAARRDTLGDEHPETLRALSRLGLLLKTADRPAEAEPLLAECVAAMTRVLGPDQPDTLVVTSYYAGVLLALGRYQETLDLTRSLRPRADSVLGPRQIEAMATVYNQGAALARLGRPDEAEFVYVHASFLREAGEYARSEALAREVLETVRRRQEGADTWGAEASYLLADVLFLQGRTDEAEPLVETLDARNLAAGSMAAYAPAEFVVFRAQCRLAQGDRAGAAALLQEAAARSASMEPGSAVVFYIASRQAALRGEEDRAAELLDRAGDRGFRLYWWLPREIVAAERGGLPAVAADLRARLEELRREARDRGETVEGIAAGSIRP